MERGELLHFFLSTCRFLFSRSLSNSFSHGSSVPSTLSSFRTHTHDRQWRPRTTHPSHLSHHPSVPRPRPRQDRCRHYIPGLHVRHRTKLSVLAELLELRKISGKEGAKARYKFILEHGEKRSRVHSSISMPVGEEGSRGVDGGK
jgi:hypothetical protein